MKTIKDSKINNKKMIIIGCFIFILIFICYKNFKLSEFDKAKKESTSFLNNNIKELQNISNELLETNKKYIGVILCWTIN